MTLNTSQKAAAEKVKELRAECERIIFRERDKLKAIEFIADVIDKLKGKSDIYIQIVKNSKETGWIMMIDAKQHEGEVSVKTWPNMGQVDNSIVPLAAEAGLVLDDKAVYGNMLIYRAYTFKG